MGDQRTEARDDDLATMSVPGQDEPDIRSRIQRMNAVRVVTEHDGGRSRWLSADSAERINAVLERVPDTSDHQSRVAATQHGVIVPENGNAERQQPIDHMLRIIVVIVISEHCHTAITGSKLENGVRQSG